MTTEAVRRAIQHSQESLRALAGRYGINPKTVAKWKKRTSAADLPTGPTEPRSTVLSIEEEAVVVAFRRLYSLLRLVEAVRYKSHTVLTDTCIQFTTPGTSGSAVPLIKEAIASGERFRARAFEHDWTTHDQGRTLLDQRPARMHEPHHQGCHRKAHIY